MRAIDNEYPVSDADPFSAGFFEGPFSVHAALRDAGPVVRLSRYGCLAVARYEQVEAVLRDWQGFSSASGVGLTDFRREPPWRLPSLVLETDPPLHDRTRGVLDRVLSPAAMRGLRADFATAADALIEALLERGSFDAIPDLAEGLSTDGVPRRGRDADREPALPAAVRQHGIQLVRTPECVFRRRGGRRGAGGRLGAGAVAA